ncbi:unnamed protein product [Rodentolepis nana]|uniref:TMEM132 domain-containing protein n=1 Tax=Rodentolepis nana TaxID=102285 RepID=A0A158QIJ6_RODNA|nr:unnamed protein product [Rodentolepis nana]
MILLDFLLIIWMVLLVGESSEIDVLNTRFLPNGAAFFTDIGSAKENSIYLQDFALIGSVDDAFLNINIGNLRVNASINPDSHSFSSQPLTTVHLFQKELFEDGPTLHFLCHSLITPELLKNLHNRHMSTCCIIKVIASNRHFFTGCLINNLTSNNRSTCHASIHIENRAWNVSLNNELDVSYRINTVHYVKSNSVNLLMDSAALSRQCWTPLATQMSNFKFLSKISLKKMQRDESREIGRNIRLDIPSRHLKNGEYFSVPVRVKEHTNIADFTLRCEIPLNTYVEFIRVVWPWEIDESSSFGRDGNVRLLQLNNGFSAWDISQRHIPSLKGNVTEVVAKYRETAIDPFPSDHFRFSTSFVNTAVLSGYPTRHPVWIYGLTHNNELQDVTSTSTCHTSDDSVAHFPKDSCSAGLVFSGGELAGGDSISLVAKVDRISASELITVWYPQLPQGVTLVAESPRGGTTTAPFTFTSTLSAGYSTSSILLRTLAE